MNLRKIKEDDQREEIVLTVYFSGTGHHIEKQSYLASFLYASNTQNENQMCLGFSGCGVTNGLSGTLFGTGLKEQCQVARKQVLDLIRQGKKVKLNCYGHSRGAIAALLLTKMLGDFDEDILEINLALLDTVPGNLLVTQKIDFLGQTLANQAMDLSKCHNLKRVLSLYTNIPLPDLSAHAPLLPKYPKKTQVEEEVLPGCHAGVQYQRVFPDKVQFNNDQSLLTFAYVSKFLRACGTALEFLGKRFFKQGTEVQIEDATVIKSIYENEKQKLQPSVRAGHSYRSVIIKTDPSQQYLNRQHQEVAQEAKMESEGIRDSFALSIEPPPSPRVSRPAIAYTEPDMTGLFNDFLADLLKGMSKESKSSAKGAIITRLQAEIVPFTDKQALKNALRNVLALILQRDRYNFSLFSTTTTGYATRGILRQEKYQALTDLIQGSSNHQLRYRDLRMFVLGENNESYFNARNRDRTYQLLQDSPLTKDNINAYLSIK